MSASVDGRGGQGRHEEPENSGPGPAPAHAQDAQEAPAEAPGEATGARPGAARARHAHGPGGAPGARRVYRRLAGLQPGIGVGTGVDTDPDPEPGTVLDSLKVAVVMLDTTGRILLWSPLAEEMLGWAGEHIVGRRVSALMAPAEPPEPPDPSGTAEPSGAARGRRRMTEVPLPGPAERILAELLRHGRWSGLLSLRHRDGHIVQAEARASLLVDGEGRPFVLASVAESSRLRILEHDLAALDALFGSSPLGVAIFDTDLRYVRVNEALARMNKLAAADHAGRRVEEIVQGPAAERLAKLQRDVLDTGVPAIDVLLPPRPGAPGAPGDAGEMIGWRSASYHRLEDRAGHVLGISCTVMDVSERQTALAKIERARQRLALINDVGARIADLLDVHLIAKTLAQTVVPAFSDFSGVILHSAVAEGGELHRGQAGEITEMRQLGIGAVRAGPDVERMISIGRIVQVTRESVFGTVLRTGRPQLIGTAEELRATTHPDDPSVEAALELGVHSLIVVPLRARGIVLGLFVITRVGEREPFDQDDLALANELADRAGASLDNARLYVREREGALMLQRGLLPQHVPHPPGVRIAHRYVPAGSGAEAGGDWFDVIPLAGGRVALVVGDVMGHGLRAAATMGRLRTAVRTLAGLDMPPEELLRRVDDLGEDLAQRPGEGWMATCVYAVYDPSTRRLAVASAGHFPPVLVGPEGTRQLDVPPGVPLGVGGVEFESVEADVPDGSVLVLYTDGLVESRGEDITEGMQRLRTVLRRPVPSLEEACDELLAVMRRGGEPDDVALLMARLGGLPEGSTVGWTFRAEPSAVRQARRCIREALRAWRLDALADTTVLLVSELVTNSLRYAHGPIGVRMVRGTSLLVEVSDPLPDPPRERTAHEEDEGGRGLQLVARASRRWGTRHGPLGKTVWFELALP